MFNFFFASNLISVVGNSISYVAVYWISAQILSPFELSLLIGSVFITRFLISTFGGPFIDNFNSSKILKFSLLLRIGLLLIVYLGLYFEKSTILFLIILLIVQTGIQVLSGNTAFKIIKLIVPEESLLKANSYLNTLERLGSLSGLVLGGVLIGSMEIENVIMLELIAHIVAFLLILNLKTNENNQDIVSFEYFSSLKEGLLYLKRDKWLMNILFAAIVANLIITPTNTLLAPYVKSVLEAGSTTFSWVQFSTVVGGIITSLWYAKSKFLKKVPLKKMFYISVILQGVIMITLSLQSNLAFSLINFLLLGGALSLFGIPFTTMLQKNTPDRLLGRVKSSMVALSTLSSAVFYVLSGYLTTFFTIQTVFLLFSSIGTVVALLLIIKSLREEKIAIKADKNIAVHIR